MSSIKKNSVAFITGLAACLALLALFGYLIIPNLMAKKAPASPATRGLVFNQQALLSVRSKVINGNLPITLQPSDLGNSQLFQ